MSSKIFHVDMTCEGCAKAVRAVLGRVQGVSDIQIDVAKKQVVVQGNADAETLLAAIKKTGKAVSLVE